VSALALDTSVAIPLLVTTHREHAVVVSWCAGRDVALSGHAVAETYSVLTRLPGDLRLSPEDAARLLRERFSAPLLLSRKVAARLPDRLSKLGLSGGAVYDALVGLAAAEHAVQLATRDARAEATYEAVGARVVIGG
jgi:predicted nucleic acid-binding protein